MKGLSFVSRTGVIVSSLMLALGASATSYTWCGAGDAGADGSRNWEDPANWLKDGKTVVEAGYPGQTDKGAASASDYAVFPADLAAKVRINAANNINTLDLKLANETVEFVAASTNDLLTVNNTIDFSTGTGTIILDKVGLVRTGDVTLGPRALTLKNGSDFRINKLTMGAQATMVVQDASCFYATHLVTADNGANAMSVSGGSYVKFTSALAFAKGASLVLDGSTLYSQPAVTFSDNATLTMSGSTFTAVGAVTFNACSVSISEGSTFYSAGNITGNKVTTFDLLGGSLFEGQNLYIGNAGFVGTLDDSTIRARGTFYFINAAPGGGVMHFKGAAPRIVVLGAGFRSDYNNAALTTPFVFDFTVPEGGYAEPPIQYVPNTTVTAFSGHGNPKAMAKFTIAADSPAATAGTQTKTTLFAALPGNYGYTKPAFCLITQPGTGSLALRAADGVSAPTSDATAKLIVATVGSGEPAPVPSVAKSAVASAFLTAVVRKTVTCTATALAKSTAAARVEARLWVGEEADGADFACVATNELPAAVMTSLVWTAPTKCFEKTYYFKVQLVDLDAAGATLSSCETAIQSAKTLDTTTYTWTGKGATPIWGDPANWTDNVNGDSLGYPQSDSATASIPTALNVTIILDAARDAGTLAPTADAFVTLVNGGSSTNENKTVFKGFTFNSQGGGVTFDGVAVSCKGAMGSAWGKTIKVTNGADLYLNSEVSPGIVAQTVVEKVSVMNVANVYLQDGDSRPDYDGLIVVDDATLVIRNSLLAPTGDSYGARMRLQGSSPRVVFTNKDAHIRANKTKGMGVVEFLVPEGGYAACPIVNTGVTTVKVGNNGTSSGAAKIEFVVDPKSPALFASTAFTQDLIDWNAAGFNTSMLTLTGAGTQGTLKVDGTKLVADIAPAAKSTGVNVTAYPSELAAEGLTYGFAGGYSEGDTVTLTAPQNATGSETMRAACRGWRLYSKDASTGVRTQVASGTGTTCSYEHDGTYHELEWLWTPEYLVTATAGNGGSVTKASEWVKHGQAPTLEAKAAAGYVFREWQGGVADGNEFFAAPKWEVTGALALTAVFDEAVYASADVTEGGTGTRDDPYTLAGAITAVGNSTTKSVVLLKGTYELAAALTISTATRIVSETGDFNDVVIRVGKDAKGNDLVINGLVQVSNAGARLSGLTIAAGRPTGATAGNLIVTGATVHNCYLTGIITSNGSKGGAMCLTGGRLTRSVIANNTFGNAVTGGGLYMEGDAALVEYCAITNNFSNGYGTGGGGVYVAGGKMTHCDILDNSSRAPLGHGSAGGGVYLAKGRVEYCLIARNTSGGSGGGGVYLANTVGAVLDHCTIVCNGAMDVAAGVASGGASGVMSNCIVWGNAVQIGLGLAKEQVTPSMQYCQGWDANCLPFVVGRNVLLSDPLCRDVAAGDYRLAPNSPCRALGYGYAPYDENALQVMIDELPDTTLLAGELSFTARTSGGCGAVALGWKIEDLNAGTASDWTDGSATFVHTFAAGHYRLTVKATDGEGTSVEFARSFFAGVTAPVYVSKTGSNTVPFATPETAANDVNVAIDYCAAGGEMVVAPGDYGVARELYVPRAVSIRATGSADDTSIYRIGQYNKGESFRVVHLKDAGAVLDGFAVTNGYYQSGRQRPGHTLFNEFGTVRNCRIAYGASVVDQYGPSAVASYNGLVEDCEIDHNYGCGPFGGGLFVYGAKSVARRCDIHDQKMAENTYSYGSAPGCCVDAGLLENSHIHDNRNGFGGKGGTCGGVKLKNAAEVRNCLINNNACGACSGGGVYVENAGCKVINCTIANNTAGENATNGRGGGISIANNMAVTLVNNVFYGNTVTMLATQAGDPDWYWGATPAIAASIIRNNVFSRLENAIGEGAVVSTQLRFVNADEGDFHADTGSPLIDAGDLWDWTETDVDLDGALRLQGNTVDLGCYEAEFSDALSCTYDVSGFETADAPVVVTVNPVGTDLEGLEVRVTLVSADGTQENLVSEWGASLTRSFAAPYGRFYVYAQIRNHKGEGLPASGKDSDVKTVVVKTAYLVTEENRTGEPAYPYVTWETAATNIEEAASVAGNGTTIWVGPGTHTLTKPIVFAGATALKSSEGPVRTVIRRAGANVTQGDKMQMLTFAVAGGWLEGVTMANGRGIDTDYGAYVNALRSTVTNCVFQNANMYYDRAGAVFNNNGHVTHCVFTNFSNQTGYGGYYYQLGDEAVGENLFICNNRPFINYYNYGACTVRGGVFRNCIVTNNAFASGSNGNRVGGVELDAGRIENCLVAFNTAGSGAGGVRVGGKDCEIVNCTIVSNTCCGTETSEPRAGGIAVQGNSSVSIVNSIVWGNAYLSTNPLSVEDETRDNLAGHAMNNTTPVVGTWTLTTSWIGGENPGFKAWFPDAGRYDFRLANDAPTRNAGTDGIVTSSVDLLGKPRRFGIRIDQGCYENQSSGLLLIVR